MDIYASVPVVKTPHFTLRLLREEDAPGLFRCYSDPAAVARMNADNCDFGFLVDTPERMAETVRYWLRHYGWRSFVRFTVVETASGEAVGTVEGFRAEVGVLRIDLMDSFETAETIAELLAFAEENFRDFFGSEALVLKAPADCAARRAALETRGWSFIDFFRTFRDYFHISLP